MKNVFISIFIVLMLACRKDSGPERKSLDFTVQSIGMEKFLEKYDKTIISLLKKTETNLLDEREREILNKGTVLLSPATDEAVLNTEKRLKTTLPDSYKDFLKTSNGLFTIYPFELWPIDRVRYLRDYNQELIDIWVSENEGGESSDSDYFIYGDRQDPVHLRPRYLIESIAISPKQGENIILINTKISPAPSELEIWDLGSNYPGAFRYRNFNEFLQKMYEDSVYHLESRNWISKDK